MKKQHAFVILLLWAVLTAFAWFSPAKAISEAERRPLAQFPAIKLEALANGKFMKDFESYSLDQFPLRDGFRSVKALFHSYVLNQQDTNGIYVEDGYAVKIEYPLNEASVKHALERFNHLYETYLKDSKVYMAVVPDKGYYLFETSGRPAMDYTQLFAMLKTGIPWAEHIDLTGCLTITDYYRTDTHWKQEQLFAPAVVISQAMGITPPKPEDYTQTLLDRPFYGVYHGQAALPMDAEPMYLLENDLLEECSVYDHETGKTLTIYDRSKLDSPDLYDVYLSGAKALLTIHNPNVPRDRELIVFRDSFGSSMVPLLVQDYAKVTLVDTRYISSDLLDQFIDFQGQDVLFLYSTLILNSSSAIK